MGMKANQKDGTPPHDQARRFGDRGTSRSRYQGHSELHLPRRKILEIAIGGPTFNLAGAPVLPAITDLARSMVNAEQATQGIMAIQDQKLTAQTGGGILPPPATSHSIKRDRRQDSVALP